MNKKKNKGGKGIQLDLATLNPPIPGNKLM